MFAIEWELWPDNPLPAHFINTFLYGILSIIIFITLKYLFKSYHELIPFLATIIFILHPIHTEVVANIKSRDEILALLFSLLTLYSFLLYLESKKHVYLIGALLSYFFALLSKESSITFLAIIPLTVYFFTNEKILNIFLKMVYFLLPVFIFFIMRDRAIGQYIDLNKTSIVDNLLVGAPNKIVYYATAIKILGLYLLKLIIPYPLACDYSFNQIKMVGFDNFSFILSFIIHAFLTIYAIITFKKKNIYSYFIIAYLISMSIYSNLFILIGSSFGERFLFAPSLFYSIFLTLIIFRVLNIPYNSRFYTLSHKLRLFSVILPILFLYGILTYNRNKDWKSSLTLYEADIKKSPESAHMNYYYGLEVMKEKAMKNGQVIEPAFLDTAIYYFKKARNIVPSFADAFDQLGLAYFRKNEWDKALAYYDTCLRLAPTKAITYSNMGVIFFNRKQYDKALEAYENAVKYNPKFSDAWMNLGSTYGTLGRFNEAIAAFKKCIEFNPQNAMAHYFLGITYQNIGDKQNAEYYLNIAYQLNPSLKKQ